MLIVNALDPQVTLLSHPAVGVEAAACIRAFARILTSVVKAGLVVWAFTVTEALSSATLNQSVTPVSSPTSDM